MKDLKRIVWSDSRDKPTNQPNGTILVGVPSGDIYKSVGNGWVLAKENAPLKLTQAEATALLADGSLRPGNVIDMEGAKGVIYGPSPNGSHYLSTINSSGTVTNVVIPVS